MFEFSNSLIKTPFCRFHWNTTFSSVLKSHLFFYLVLVYFYWIKLNYVNRVYKIVLVRNEASSDYTLKITLPEWFCAISIKRIEILIRIYFYWQFLLNYKKVNILLLYKYRKKSVKIYHSQAVSLPITPDRSLMTAYRAGVQAAITNFLKTTRRAAVGKGVLNLFSLRCYLSRNCCKVIERMHNFTKITKV